MGEPLRIGIIGASADSGWARTSHVPALAATPGAALHAVATSNQASADEAAARFGAVRAFAGSAALAASPEVDLAVVSVKAPAHLDTVTATIMAGRPTLCEWPLGANLAESERLADLARNRGVRGIIGLQSRFAPAAAYARRLIDEGYVGEVQAVSLRAAFSFWGAMLPAAYLGDMAAGANVLTISGGHCLDLMTWLAGDVAEIGGTLSFRHRMGIATDADSPVPITTPDQFTAQGRLCNGALFSAHIVGDAPAEQNFRLRITGTLGQIELTAPGMPEIEPLSLSGYQGEGPLAPLAVPAAYRPFGDDLPSHVENYAHFYTALTGGAALPGFDDAVRLHRLLDAIAISSTTGARQTL